MTDTIREVDAVMMLTKYCEHHDPEYVIGIRISNEELMRVPTAVKMEAEGEHEASGGEIAIIRRPDGSYGYYGCGDPFFPLQKIIIEESDDGSYRTPGRDAAPRYLAEKASA